MATKIDYYDTVIDVLVRMPEDEYLNETLTVDKINEMIGQYYLMLDNQGIYYLNTIIRSDKRLDQLCKSLRERSRKVALKESEGVEFRKEYREALYRYMWLMQSYCMDNYITPNNKSTGREGQ